MTSCPSQKEPKARSKSARHQVSWPLMHSKKSSRLIRRAHDIKCRDLLDKLKRAQGSMWELTTSSVVTSYAIKKSSKLKTVSSRHQMSWPPVIFKKAMALRGFSWHQNVVISRSVVVSRRLTSCPHGMLSSHSWHAIWDHSQLDTKCLKDMQHIPGWNIYITCSIPI